MKNNLTHFAIYIENMERAAKFYGSIFEWEFSGYGAPDFLQIRLTDNEEQNPIGALQHSKYSLIPEKVKGFECSIEVSDIDQTEKAILSAGGKILMPKTEIPHVGWIIKFQDTEGNIVCVIQYF
ncbi:MAG: VOC family protein [Cyclobacteriaceae bacterium]